MRSRVYRDARRTLTRELGLEPDEELRALEQRILAHDPVLQAPPLASPPGRGAHCRHIGPCAHLPTAAVARPRSRLVRGRRGGGWSARPRARRVSGGARRPRRTRSRWSMPEQGAVVAAIPVGREPVTVVAGAGAVWAANIGDRTLSRIDTVTLQVTKIVGLGFEPTDLAADADHVWVAGGYDHVLWRVDRDGVAAPEAHVRGGARSPPRGLRAWRRPAVALNGDSVWLSHGDEITELDPITGDVRSTIRAGGTVAQGDRRRTGTSSGSATTTPPARRALSQKPASTRSTYGRAAGSTAPSSSPTRPRSSSRASDFGLRSV